MKNFILLALITFSMPNLDVVERNELANKLFGMNVLIVPQKIVIPKILETSAWPAIPALNKLP